MDKNQIHIDEVVRQRLAGAEEERRPGAWFAMREVLDKAMPVGGAAVSAFNWRRMLSYTSAILVAASASFGGYKLYEQQKSSEQLAVNAPAVPARVEGTTGKTTGNTAANTASGTNSGNSTPSGTQGINGSANPTSSTNANTASVSNNASAYVAPTNTGTRNTNNSSSHTSNSTQPGNQPAIGSSTAASSGPLASNISAGNNTPSGNSVSNSNANSGTPALNGTNSPAASTETASTGNNNSRNGNRRPRAARRNPTASSPVLAAGNTGIATVNASRTRRITKIDTSHIIEQAIRMGYNPLTMKSTPRIDTLSKRIITIQREVDIPVYDEDRVKATNPRHSLNHKGESIIVPNAAPPATPVQFATENNAATEQRNVLAKSKKQQLSLWDRMNMQSAIDRTRSAFAQIEYRGGFAGGFNYTFGGTSLFGFQLGLMGIAFISPEWSILGELKYFQRANRGSSFVDDYVHRSPAGNGNVWEDSVNHFFNFSTLQTIEMPIMARYVKKNFYGLLGLNMVRTLPVNTEEVTHQHNNPTLQQSNTLSPTARQSADITSRDFDPRFGMGYVLGVGYQLTPAIGLDLRVAQMLWDNARNDNGAQRVSKELYKVPSIQLTAGYRFGSK